MRRGFSLIELLISISLLGFILTGSWCAALLLGKRMFADKGEALLKMQLANALSDVRLHCISASKVADGSMFAPGVESGKSAFLFRGQKDVYGVTPSILSDDTWYLYTKNRAGDIVLREVSASGAALSEEVLVEAKYAPEMDFRYKAGFEPNFLEVTISGNVTKPEGVQRAVQKIGARFWFVGVLAL